VRVRTTLAAVTLVAAAAGAAVWWVRTPYAGFTGSVFVDIPKGTGTIGIARLLANAGVIEHPLQFWLIRAAHPAVRLQAGEYLFNKPASPWRVFERLKRGDVFFYVLAVPEGSNMFDIAAALAHEGIMPPEAFLAAAHDPAPIRDLDPKAPSLEGYLFPDTYHLTRHNTAEDFCRLMTGRFRKVWNKLGPPQADVHDTVTLASLVEKEARLGKERPVIASVFLNRLGLNMPLQCDPTVIYAAQLEHRYRGAIYRSDLQSEQLYNTYQHSGLPPGPIANPGLDSLQAALHPAETDFLYFVLRPGDSGAHQFSKELAQHQRAVQQYRRGLRQEQQTNGARRLPRAKPAQPRNGIGVGGAEDPARADHGKLSAPPAARNRSAAGAVGGRRAPGVARRSEAQSAGDR
jgi:UPF0755 protein